LRRKRVSTPAILISGWLLLVAADPATESTAGSDLGLQVDLVSLLEPSALALGALLILGAVIGKLVCGLGVIGHGINRPAVGLGMIPRGEVGLIFAGIGARVFIEGQPILTQNVYSAVVMMVLITTLLTPLGLRWVFRK
jgi:Kef-type K+ transport system membrane component KefB